MKKTVIVTGSEGLIGSSAISYLRSLGHDCLGLDFKLGHDLSDEKFVNNFFKNNKADALVNLFALNHHIDSNIEKNKLFDITLESFREYLEINLTSLFSVCRSFAKNNNSGSIVNFSSTYGISSPRPDMYDDDEKHIGYGVSKAGVVMLTKHLATHLAPAIRVNTIIPGGVYNGHDLTFVEKYSKNNAMGRMMDVKELNGAIAFLVSDDSSYVTASNIVVDGGWTAW